MAAGNPLDRQVQVACRQPTDSKFIPIHRNRSFRISLLKAQFEFSHDSDRYFLEANKACKKSSAKRLVDGSNLTFLQGYGIVLVIRATLLIYTPELI
jgi:hypothetical protein